MSRLVEGGQSDHFGNLLGGNGRKASRARSILFQAGQVLCKKAPAPMGGLLDRSGECCVDLQVRFSVCCGQDHASPLGCAYLSLATVCPII